MRQTEVNHGTFPSFDDRCRNGRRCADGAGFTGDKAAAIAKLEKALDGRFSPLNFCTKDMVREEVERLKK